MRPNPLHPSPASTRRRGRRALIGLLAATALVLSAAACGGDDGNGDDPPTTPAGNGNGSEPEPTDSDNGDAASPANDVEAVSRCDQTPEPGPGPVNRGAVVAMVDFVFCEESVTVSAGEAVEFISFGSVRHQVVHTPSDPGEEQRFQSQTLATGDSFLHLFDTAGTFTYICAFHPDDMVAEVVVEE